MTSARSIKVGKFVVDDVFFYTGSTKLGGKYAVSRRGNVELDRTGQPIMQLVDIPVWRGELSDTRAPVVCKVVGSLQDVEFFRSFVESEDADAINAKASLPEYVGHGLVDTSRLEKRGVELMTNQVRDVGSVMCVIMSRLPGSNLRQILADSEADPSIVQRIPSAEKLSVCDLEHILWESAYKGVDRDPLLSVNDPHIFDYHNCPPDTTPHEVMWWRFLVSAIKDTTTGVPTRFGRNSGIRALVARILCLPDRALAERQEPYYPYRAKPPPAVLGPSDITLAVDTFVQSSMQSVSADDRVAFAHLIRMHAPFIAACQARGVFFLDNKIENCVLDL